MSTAQCVRLPSERLFESQQASFASRTSSHGKQKPATPPHPRPRLPLLGVSRITQLGHLAAQAAPRLPAQPPSTVMLAAVLSQPRSQAKHLRETEQGGC